MPLGMILRILSFFRDISCGKILETWTEEACWILLLLLPPLWCSSHLQHFFSVLFPSLYWGLHFSYVFMCLIAWLICSLVCSHEDLRISLHTLLEWSLNGWPQPDPQASTFHKKRERKTEQLVTPEKTILGFLVYASDDDYDRTFVLLRCFVRKISGDLNWRGTISLSD